MVLLHSRHSTFPFVQFKTHIIMAFISFFRLRSAIVFLLLLITQVTAHLHLSSDELVDYHRQIKRDSEALSKCLKSPAMQEHNARMLTYRNETLHKLRIARGIDPHIGNFPD